jgi:hypothetical protein
MEVSQHPRQCKEGHLFCLDCVQKQIEVNPSCPLCRQPISMNSISRNLIAEMAVENLMIWCKYHFDWEDGTNWTKNDVDGCPESFPSMQLASHERHCQFAWAVCPFSSQGQRCSERNLRKKTLKEHERVCLYRTIECEFCFGSVPYHAFDSHMMECDSIPVQCRYCDMKVSRRNLNEHEQLSCQESHVLCPYDCQVKVKRRELPEHNRVSVVEHLEFLNLRMHEKYSLELQEREKVIHELQGKIENLNKRIQVLSESSCIEWNIEWKKVEHLIYVTEDFYFQDLNLTIWLYPNGDTEESSGHISLFISYENEKDLVRKIFKKAQDNKKAYIKKLKYFFEIVNLREAVNTVRSGDILFSLFQNNEPNCLMKGERKMIRNDQMNKESGFLNEKGELQVMLHLHILKTNVILG